MFDSIMTSIFQKRNNLNDTSRPWIVALKAALITGILVHLFALVNLMHNHDNIASQPGGYGIGIQFGRWFLEVIGRITLLLGFNYNLPWVNGIVFLFFLSLGAGLLVSCLQIHDRNSAALIGALFIAFPTVAATLFFRFTCQFYGLAVFLAVFAAWVLDWSKFGIVLSAIAVGLSMGIYQAYAPITISLFVLILIKQTFSGNVTVKELFCHGLKECAALILGVIFYYGCLNIFLNVWNVSLDSYVGIEISLSQILSSAAQAFILFFQKNTDVSGRGFIQLVYLCLGIVTAVEIAYMLLFKTKKSILSLAALALLLLLPIAVNFIVVMCPGVWIYSLMLYSFVLIGCVPLTLLDCLPQEKRFEKGNGILRKSTFLFVLLLVFSYGYFNNVNYTAQYYANRQIENYIGSIVTQVRMTKGFTPEKQWAFIGEIQDPLLSSAWDEETFYTGSGDASYLLNQYSWRGWIKNHIGYNVPQANDETIDMLRKSSEVAEMPCWPSEGSVQVIGDCVVIKFQNESPR